MKLVMFLTLLALAPLGLTGCGGATDGLATDSGEMTLEEFEELQRQEQAQVNESMQQAQQP